MPIIAFSTDVLTQEYLRTLHSLVEGYGPKQTYLIVRYPAQLAAHPALTHSTYPEQTLDKTEVLSKQLASNLGIKSSHCWLAEENTFSLANLEQKIKQPTDLSSWASGTHGLTAAIDNSKMSSFPRSRLVLVANMSVCATHWNYPNHRAFNKVKSLRMEC